MMDWKRFAASLLTVIGTCFTGQTADLVSPAPPDTPITYQLSAAERALPGLDILLVSNEDPRARQIVKTDQFFQRHHLNIADFDDEELRRLGDPRARGQYLEEAAWPFTGNHGEALCVITLHRRDYRQAGPHYWEADWSLPAGTVRLKIDPVAVGNWDVNHEIFHCMARPLRLEHPGWIASEPEQTLYDEASADAYAALEQARQTEGGGFIDVVASIRQVLARHDRTHYTKDVLDYIYQHPQQYNRDTLKHLSPVQLAYLAHRIVATQWPFLKASFNDAGPPGARKMIQARGYRHLQLLAVEARERPVSSMFAQLYRWVDCALRQTQQDCSLLHAAHSTRPIAQAGRMVRFPGTPLSHQWQGQVNAPGGLSHAPNRCRFLWLFRGLLQ